MPISRRVGNKQAESSQLGIIAISFLKQGNYEMSLKFHLDGIKIKRMIGDKQGECVMLVNIVNVYNLLGMKKEAIKANQDCLILAKQIGNKQIENMATILASIISQKAQ